MKQLINLKEENEKLRVDLTNLSNDNPIIENLKMKNIRIYLLAVLIPPIGIWYIWKKENTLSKAAKIVWSMIGCIVIYQYMLLI